MLIQIEPASAVTTLLSSPKSEELLPLNITIAGEAGNMSPR